MGWKEGEEEKAAAKSICNIFNKNYIIDALSEEHDSYVSTGTDQFGFGLNRGAQNRGQTYVNAQLTRLMKRYGGYFATQ